MPLIILWSCPPPPPRRHHHHQHLHHHLYSPSIPQVEGSNHQFLHGKRHKRYDSPSSPDEHFHQWPGCPIHKLYKWVISKIYSSYQPFKLTSWTIRMSLNLKKDLMKLLALMAIQSKLMVHWLGLPSTSQQLGRLPPFRESLGRGESLKLRCKKTTSLAPGSTFMNQLFMVT